MLNNIDNGYVYVFIEVSCISVVCIVVLVVFVVWVFYGVFMSIGVVGSGFIV